MEATAKPYEGAAPELVAAVGGELDPERIIRTQLARARVHLQHIEPGLVETLERLAQVTLQRGIWP